MTTKTTVFLLYDERMTYHRPPGTDVCSESHCSPELLDEEGNPTIFENASRIVRLYETAMKIEERLTGHPIVKSNPSNATITFVDEEEEEEEDNIRDNITRGNQQHFQQNCLWATNPAAPHNQSRFIALKATPCPRDIIELAHTREHYNNILRTSHYTDAELQAATGDDNDIYYCRDTFYAATLACGGVVNCVHAVTESMRSPGTPSRAIALVRPPGHHATHDRAQGFCYLNNIAVAAKYAVASGRAERVFILDWDIHHGNGIQDITYDDTSIFYLSLHRGCFGSKAKEWFYPGTGKPNEVGRGTASGSNLNIAWGKGNMGDTQYSAAFQEAVLPVLSSFNPDLIIVACGFDAAKGDLLGDCGLSPFMYYIMTKSLLETCGDDIPLVMALEGGYNLDLISKCFEATALAMLDEPLSEELNPLDSNIEDAPPIATSVLVEPKPVQRRMLRKMFLDDQHLTLQRYWHHEDLVLFQDKQKQDTQKQGQDKITASALSAIKKSVRALVHNGGFRGRLPMATQRVDNESDLLPPIQQIVPLCNRPVQSKYVLPRKMRNDHYVESDDDDDDCSRHCNIDDEEYRFPLKKRRLRRSSSFDIGMYGSEKHCYKESDVEYLMGFQ